MGIDLSNLTIDKAATTVNFGGQSAKITYRPSLITQETLERLDEEDDGTLQFLSNTLIEWDVKSSGKKVPLNPKALRPLPLPFLRAVVLSIMRDRGDGVGEAEKPSAGS